MLMRATFILLRAADDIVQKVRTFIEDNKELFLIREASLELAKGLAEKTKDIPEEGLEEMIWHEYDASKIYGEGWSYIISVKWQTQFSCYWLELAVYKYSCPYKCSSLLFTGPKALIMKHIETPEHELYEKIQWAAPRLHHDLEGG